MRADGFRQRVVELADDLTALVHDDEEKAVPDWQNLHLAAREVTNDDRGRPTPFQPLEEDLSVVVSEGEDWVF
jgi:hypothetical protein